MAKEQRTPSPKAKRFGEYFKRVRTERDLTQEQLAERSDLAADTVRRIEHGDFSPSLGTLEKLATGLRVDLSTLFTAFEHGDSGREREILAMARTLSPGERVLCFRLLAFLVALLGAVMAAPASGGDGE
jgi:transcriptional regulator with XRE-family HTH domain